MNRFEYADSRLQPNETFVRRDTAVRLYDGDTKVIYKRLKYYISCIKSLVIETSILYSDLKTSLSCSLIYLVFHNYIILNESCEYMLILKDILILK